MKSLCFALCLLFSNAVIAQQKFIEVNVSDTVLVDPDIFVYRIVVMPENDMGYEELRYENPAVFERKAAVKTKRLKAFYDSVINLLLRSGFTLLPPRLADTFNISANPPDFYTADLLLHAVDSVALLCNRLKEIKTVTGNIAASMATDETHHYSRLQQKLLQQAERKAKEIAGLIGMKIAGVQSVTEHSKEKSAGWTAYPPLSELPNSAIPGWHTIIKAREDLNITRSSISTSYPIESSLTVRFLVE